MKKRLALFLMVVLALALTGCIHASKDGQVFESYIPPETGEVGEPIKLDPANTLTIKDHRIETLEDGARVLIITYDWENTSDRAFVGSDAYVITASQEGIGLTPDLSKITDKKKLVTEVPGHETLEDIEQGFILDGDGDVTLTLDGKINTVFVDGKPQFAWPVKVTLTPES